MQPRHKLPLALAALLFTLAALAEMATGRSRNTQGDAEERGRRAALVRVDEALARGDAATAREAWREAYEAARMNRGWRGLVEAGDARSRIETQTHVAVAPRARQVYLAALSRARAERSVDGAVRVAESVSELGDREVTERALRIAAALAVGSHDAEAPLRVETARGRLLESASRPTRATL